MAKPAKTINKVQTDSSNTFDIVPTMMTDETGTYKAELPTLTKDETILVESDAPTIKRFI